jgi:DNA-binding NtrC family response regulator
MKILIVDDDRPTADKVADLLHKHEHRTLSLYSRKNALEHLKHLWFDLVILDSPVLAERILGNLIHPEVMALDSPVLMENLVCQVQEVERRLELERQQVLEWLMEE